MKGSESKGYIQEYPCKCSGGDICYIVRHPKTKDCPVGYPTKEKAERELERLNNDEIWY